ncbi:pilus (MSHA type) biogenesis protein MshL [Vibrio sp. S9_S30]|uniref:pilus (MSHA type) biogenesis protein MshL n=1 Tax=Vibrio sp. S9_S30 TaxID=2720226 RepID=UPI0016807362|nr:pilus (MSHA type) biogenesis protein MshL [Vibrio sp. S9_S30]MBD1558977.1 pilus (MSHA type) biogenesis protein MshL [Vibrio sp. S9_S30]
MRNIVVAIIIVSLTACSMGHRDPVEVKEALNDVINEASSKSLEDLPASVQADLMPDLESEEFVVSPTLKRFRVQANGVEAKTFFAGLVKGTDYSTAIHPDVAGRITMNLTDVTLDEVLKVVRDLYGFEVVQSGKLIQIYPAGLRTETIPVDYLQFKRLGRSLTSIATGTITSKDDESSTSSSGTSSGSSSSSTGGTEIETISESDFWVQLEKAVQTLIGSGEGRNVVVSPQASVLTIRAYPDEIREIRQFLGVSQQRMQRQVILEAKILEVTLSDGYQQGINWSGLTSTFGNANVLIGRGLIPADGSAPILPGLDAIGSLLGGQTNVTIKNGDFAGVLSFVGTQGDLNVLSSPRVTAANNQKAVIKVGSDEYFVTNISSVVGSGDNANTAPNIELTPFFSGISLDVTPQIDDEGFVLLHVHPAVIDVQTQTKVINLEGKKYEVPLAKSSIRESDSVIRARDGDVVVIGGLMKSNTIDQVSKIPFLGDVPGLGHLFRNVTKLTQKTELVILLRPTVVGVNTWQQELERSRDLLQEWFPEE